MKRFLALVLNDVRLLHRTGYIWATLLIFAVLLFIALQFGRLDFTGFGSLVSAIILLDLVLAPVLVVGLMLLLERGEGSLLALAATPLPPGLFVLARTLVVSVISSAEMGLLALIVYDGPLSLPFFVGGLLSLAAVASLSAFLLVAPFNSLYSFILPMFGWILLLSLPGYGVLMRWDPWWLAWHPTAPSMALIEAAFGPVPAERIGFAMGAAAAWIVFLSLLALRAVRFMQLRTAGA